MTPEPNPVGPAPRSRVPFEREVDRGIATYRQMVAGTHPAAFRFRLLVERLEKNIVTRKDNHR